MTKIAEPNGIILKDRYYIWTYRPKEYWKLADRITSEKNLYKKHICAIGYLSRYHAKKVVTYLYGVDSLSYIHIIKGKKLIDQGIKEITVKKFKCRVFIKGKPVKLKKWVFPIESQINTHRRRKFTLKMYNIFRRYGRKKFDYELKLALYGQRPGFDSYYLKKKAISVNAYLIQAYPEINPYPEGYTEYLKKTYRFVDGKTDALVQLKNTGVFRNFTPKGRPRGNPNFSKKASAIDKG